MKTFCAIAGGGSSGPYWSGLAQLTLPVNATGFFGNPSANSLVVSGQVTPPAGWAAVGGSVTIPSYTVNVYADTSGQLSGSALSGELVGSYSESSFTAAATDNQFSVSLPANVINLDSFETPGDKFFLFAQINITGESPIDIRFQGGTFQASDGTVWVIGGASPDAETPETSQFTDTATIESVPDGTAYGGVSVDETVTDSEGDTSTFQQTFHAPSGAAGATVFTSTYDGTSTINASTLNSVWPLDAVAGNANDTITEGAGNDNIALGNGSNTINTGSGHEQIALGDGNNTINVYGGATLKVGGGNNAITVVGNGNVTVQGIPGDEDGDNKVTQSGSGNATVSLGDGDDSVALGSGANTVTLGNGNNTLAVAGSATINVGNGNNAITAPVIGSNIIAGDGDNTIYQTGNGTSGVDGVISAGSGNNTFFMNGQSLGNLQIACGSGMNDLAVTNLASRTTATVSGSTVSLPVGGQIGYSSAFSSMFNSVSLLVNGGTSNTLTLDDGGEAAGLPSLPSGSNLTLANGTSLDLEGQSITVDNLTLNGGTITDGSIYASTYTLTNGEVNANLSGGAATVSGGNVTLTGTNTFSSVNISGGTLAVPSAASLGSGTITFGAGGVLQALGDLTSSQSIATPSGVSGTIDSNGNTVAWSGAISGSGGMIFADSGGGGLVLLSGSNSYGGGTTIAGGMVEFSTSGSLPSTAANSILIQAGGALEASGAYPTAAEWLASGVISTASNGALALAANESDINLSGYDALYIGAAMNVTFSGTLEPAGGNYLLGGGPATLTVTSALTGSNGVVIDGDVVLNGANTYSGGTTIAAGTLGIYAGSNLGNGGLTLNAGTLQALATVTLSSVTTSADASLTSSIDTNGNYVALSGISGQAGLDVLDSSGNATGVLDFSACASTSSEFFGSVTVMGGFVAANNIADLGNGIEDLNNGTTALIFDGGGLRATGSFTIPSTTEIDDPSGATFDTNGFKLEVDAAIGVAGDAGGVNVMDTSTGSRGDLDLTTANNYLGGTTIVSGTLTIDGDAVLGPAPATPAINITFAGSGTLQWATNTNFELDGNRSIAIGADGATSPIATFDSNGNSASIDGQISGSGSATFVDAGGAGGSMILYAANSFTGVTTVGSSTETLYLSNAQSLGNSTFDTSGQGALGFWASPVTFGGLQGDNNLPLNGAALIIGGGANATKTVFSGELTGGGSLTLDAPDAELILAGNNSDFGGVVTAAAGILEAVCPNALPSASGDVAVDAGAILAGALSGNGDGGSGSGDSPWTLSEIASLKGSGDFGQNAILGIDVGSGTFEYNNTNNTPIADPGTDSPLGLVVLGSGGTLTLDGGGSNTFSGGTTVVDATLIAGSSTFLGGSGASVTVIGGTLNMNDRLVRARGRDRHR